MPTGEIPNVDAQSSHIRSQLHLIGRPRTAVRIPIEIPSEIAARMGPIRYSTVSIPSDYATEPYPPTLCLEASALQKSICIAS